MSTGVAVSGAGLRRKLHTFFSYSFCSNIICDYCPFQKKKKKLSIALLQDLQSNLQPSCGIGYHIFILNAGRTKLTEGVFTILSAELRRDEGSQMLGSIEDITS